MVFLIVSWFEKVAAASAERMMTCTTSETLHAGSRCRRRARYRRRDVSLRALGAGWRFEAVGSPDMLDEAAAVPLVRAPFPGLGVMASRSGMIELSALSTTAVVVVRGRSGSNEAAAIAAASAGDGARGG